MTQQYPGEPSARPTFTPHQQQTWPQQQPYPPQQQPYPAQQQPYPPYGQQSYAQPQQPGPPPRRRRRRKLRAFLWSFVGLVAAIIAITSAESGNHTVTSTGQASSTSASSAPASAANPAGIGSAITLTGNSSGEQMAVTVVTVFRHAQPASSFDAPDAGDRLYAVQFRLTDTGTAAYSDAPSNGATVVDASGQSYQSSLDNAAECQSFPGTENIAPGASGLGCIVFEVPRTAIITGVQFTLDSGMGPQTGQWDVRR